MFEDGIVAAHRARLYVADEVVQDHGVGLHARILVAEEFPLEDGVVVADPRIDQLEASLGTEGLLRVQPLFGDGGEDRIERHTPSHGDGTAQDQHAPGAGWLRLDGLRAAVAQRIQCNLHAHQFGAARRAMDMADDSAWIALLEFARILDHLDVVDESLARDHPHHDFPEGKSDEGGENGHDNAGENDALFWAWVEADGWRADWKVRPRRAAKRGRYSRSPHTRKLNPDGIRKAGPASSLNRGEVRQFLIVGASKGITHRVSSLHAVTSAHVSELCVFAVPTFEIIAGRVDFESMPLVKSWPINLKVERRAAPT